MKTLSIKQPWLYAITHLDKRIENRTWSPPQKLLGQTIALHASARDDPFGYDGIFEIAGVRVEHDLPRSVIVATAKVVGWINEKGNGFCLSPCLGSLLDDKWFFGPIGWILDDVKLFDQPVPARGALGLWSWSL